MKKQLMAITVMLMAATVVAFSCLAFRVPIGSTILYISLTMVFFYIIGLIIFAIFSKINREADGNAHLVDDEDDKEDNDR